MSSKITTKLFQQKSSIFLQMKYTQLLQDRKRKVVRIQKIFYDKIDHKSKVQFNKK